MVAAAATAVRILIVEDDTDACDALLAVLNAQGFDTESARTVGEALVRLERGIIPAAIVVDMRLPDASGGLLLRRIHREQLPTKVAVVTGMANPMSHPDLVRFPPGIHKAARLFRTDPVVARTDVKRQSVAIFAAARARSSGMD